MNEINTTPNKPLHTPRRASGLYTKPTMSYRNSYQNSVIKFNVDKDSYIGKEKSDDETKFSNNEVSTKTPSVASETPKQPKVSESWASNIFSQISNWMKKDLTTFPCKCSEPDKELN